MIHPQRPLTEAILATPTWMWEEEAQADYTEYLLHCECEVHEIVPFAEWLERSGVRLL